MTVRHMRIFLEVYRLGSITRAAEVLHMTQPAVTRAIQELERYYGVKLFDRMNRRLLATEAGRQLYGQALHLIDLFDRMERSLRNWDALGVLRVGASITLGNALLPDLILHFRECHPELKVPAAVSNSGTLLQALLDNQLDLALIEDGVAHPDLIAQPFSADRLVLIVPPGHPLLEQDEVCLEDLVAYDLLLREKGSAARTYLENLFAMRGLPLQPTWESVSTQALVGAVRKGLGIALLPRSLVQSALAAKEVFACHIAGELMERKDLIVWHKNKYLSPAAEDFIALCKRFGTGEPEEVKGGPS